MKTSKLILFVMALFSMILSFSCIVTVQDETNSGGEIEDSGEENGSQGDSLQTYETKITEDGGSIVFGDITAEFKISGDANVTLTKLELDELIEKLEQENLSIDAQEDGSELISSVEMSLSGIERANEDAQISFDTSDISLDLFSDVDIEALLSEALPATFFKSYSNYVVSSVGFVKRDTSYEPYYLPLSFNKGEKRIVATLPSEIFNYTVRDGAVEIIVSIFISYLGSVPRIVDERGEGQLISELPEINESFEYDESGEDVAQNEQNREEATHEEAAAASGQSSDASNEPVAQENEQAQAHDDSNQEEIEDENEEEMEEEMDDVGDDEEFEDELSCERPYITLSVENVISYPAGGNWMFDKDDSPFLENASINNRVFAYENFTSDYEGDDICDNLGDINLGNTVSAVGGQGMIADMYDWEDVEVEVSVGDNSISSFEHINVVDPFTDWATLGEAGDLRVYSGGEPEIIIDGDSKLVLFNMEFNLLVAYPAPVGPDEDEGYAVGIGTAEIDTNLSDPAWIEAFDPNGTGLVEIVFDSMSPTVQGCYGLYDAEITIRPIAYEGCDDPRNDDFDEDGLVDALDVY